MLCSLLLAAALGAQVERIVAAAPGAFDGLKSGRERADKDGNRTWDSSVALLPGKPCAVWQYADGQRYAPSHRCTLLDLAPCGRARARFRAALRGVSRALGPEWKLREDRNETGIVRTSLRKGQGPVVMVDLVPVPSLGRCDVHVNVDAH